MIFFTLVKQLTVTDLKWPKSQDPAYDESKTTKYSMVVKMLASGFSWSAVILGGQFSFKKKVWTSHYLSEKDTEKLIQSAWNDYR